MIDTFGNTIIPIDYFFIDSFIDEIASVYLGESRQSLPPILESGKMNKGGVLVESFKPYSIRTSSNFSRRKYIDKGNKVLIPSISNRPIELEDGTALVYKKKKQGMINTHKNIIIPIKYDYISRVFNDDMVNVERNDKYGFFDIKEKKLSIPLNYDSFSNFSEGLAPVKKDGKWGYIDKDNKIVIPFIYDGAKEFKNGIAEVRNIVKKFERGDQSKKFYINKKGEIIEHEFN